MSGLAALVSDGWVGTPVVLATTIGGAVGARGQLAATTRWISARRVRPLRDRPDPARTKGACPVGPLMLYRLLRSSDPDSDDRQRPIAVRYGNDPPSSAAPPSRPTVASVNGFFAHDHLNLVGPRGVHGPRLELTTRLLAPAPHPRSSRPA